MISPYSYHIFQIYMLPYFVRKNRHIFRDCDKEPGPVSLRTGFSERLSEFGTICCIEAVFRFLCMPVPGTHGRLVKTQVVKM